MKRKFLLVCVVLMIFSCNLVLAATESITAILNKELKVVYNNEIQEFKNVKGEKVYPISYLGSTYLPIRSISSLFHTKIKWDGNTNSIYLGEGEEETISASTIMNFISQESNEIGAIVNRDIKIYYNDSIQTFKDEKGVYLYPISYQGTTYLPIRAVSSLFDLNISWNGNTKTVTINTKDVTVESDNILETEELIIPKIPTESFASKAKQHTTSPANINDVGVVYTNAGVGFDEAGEIIIKHSPIYLEFVNVYTDEDATKIIEKYNNQTFHTYTKKDDTKLYCALFNLDLSDYVFNNEPEDDFVLITFAPMGNVSVYDLNNGKMGKCDFTIINREENKTYYKTGDITQIYVVFEVPKEVAPSAITINFVNENDYSYESFFKSYLF